MNDPGRESPAPAGRVAVVCLVGLVALSLAAGGAAAVKEPADGRLVVELDADGDATVEFTNHSDLNDQEQRERFEAIRDDEGTRDAVAQQRRDEMQFVTDQANEEVDREIRVGEVSVETETDGDVGIVTYRFEWENLAAVDGDRVVLAEPFSMYDELDRELVVVAPEGYELTSVTPQPDDRNETTASWPGLTDLGGFEVVATGDGGSGDGGSGDGGSGDGGSDDGGSDDDGSFADGAGFGVSLAVGSLLAAALLARRRR